MLTIVQNMVHINDEKSSSSEKELRMGVTKEQYV